KIGVSFHLQSDGAVGRQRRGACNRQRQCLSRRKPRVDQNALSVQRRGRHKIAFLDGGGRAFQPQSRAVQRDRAPRRRQCPSELRIRRQNAVHVERRRKQLG